MNTTLSRVLIVMVVAAILSTAWGQGAETEPGKSPAVLLEKGIFNEETAGDLDAAIAIYRKIIDTTRAGRKHIAEAHLRLGTCLLKKREAKEAEAVFKALVEGYPEQKELVVKAREQIALSRKRITGKELAAIVDTAVMTISTCAETDPKVQKSLDTLDGLNEKEAVAAIASHLDAKKNTMRRAAIYILWKGPFESIAPAEETLLKLCSHSENYTRGMAAMALGGKRVIAGLQPLCDMALKDQDGFARRCAAYALGLLGDDRAKEILQKALKDTDAMVRNNAEAALTMLAMATAGKVQLPPDVMAYIADIHMKALSRAMGKGMNANAHIYGVDDTFNKYFGGLLLYRNGTESVIKDEIAVGNFDSRSKGMDLYADTGKPQKFRFVDRQTSRGGRFRLMWTPDRPIKPGEVRMLGYKYRRTEQLPKAEGGHRLRMSNHFGAPVIESFFMVVPANVRIVSESEKHISKKRIGIFDIYLYQREVPENTTNTVDVVLSLGHAARSVTREESLAEARRVGEAFLLSLRSGKAEQASALTASKSRESHLKFITKMLKHADFKAAKVADVLASSNSACLVLSGIAVKDRPMSMGLALRRDESGRLLIRDIDALPNDETKSDFIAGFQKSLYTSTPRRREHMDPVSVRHSQDVSAKGWRLWNQKKYPEAEERFGVAVLLDPTNDNAWNGLGWALQNQGKSLGAAESFKKCLAINTKHPAALNGLGWIAKGQSKIDEAIAYWKQAVESDPNTTAALNGLASTYAEQSKYDMAVKYYEMWLKVEPGNEVAKKGLADTKAAATKR